MKDNNAVIPRILNKKCIYLTKGDIYALVKEYATPEDKKELKKMIASGKTNFSTIRSWAYYKFVNTTNSMKNTSNEDFIEALLKL